MHFEGICGLKTELNYHFKQWKRRFNTNFVSNILFVNIPYFCVMFNKTTAFGTLYRLKDNNQIWVKMCSQHNVYEGSGTNL